MWHELWVEVSDPVKRNRRPSGGGGREKSKSGMGKCE